MISEENLNKLYKNVVDGIELTTKELNSLGFNSKDLNDLIERGSIIRIKRGLYDLKSVDELFYYGKQLIAQKEYDKATQCFEKCFQIDPTHTGVCFQLFLRCIQNKDYEKAFVYFDNFYNSENKFYNADSNFYLYMLSMITELPENHREYAKYLKLEDFRVDYRDKRYTNIHLQNKIRISALNQRFTLAVKQLNESIQENGRLSVQDIIIKILLSQAIEVQIQNRNTVINLIKQKKYEEIIEFYEGLFNSHHLSISDSYTLILTRELLNIIKSKNVPEKQIYSTENVFEAIDGKNFELALSLASARNQKLNVNSDNDTIYLLLNEVVNRIKELKDNVSPVNEITSVITLEEKFKPVIEPQTVVVTHTSDISSSATFADVIRFLMNNDLDNSFRTLRNYLVSINKSKYEFLIIDLIKISLLEGDIAFTKPMTALTLVSRENYSFDISIYIQEFYINLSQNKFEESRLYLDIISKGNKLGQDCVITDGLYQVLEASEKMLNYKRNNNVLTLVDKALENSKTSQPLSTLQIVSHTEPQVQPKQQPVVESIPVISKVQPVQSQPQPQQIIKEKVTQEKRDSEKEFITRKYEELTEKKGIILLRPMDDARIDRIFEMIEDYPDMVAFVIEEENQQQVVLRYKPVIDEYVDGKNLIKLGNQAYKDGNYNECIENYLQLLQLFAEPRSAIYSKLGLAYLKKSQIPLAIDYLTVANALAKKEKAYFDFSDLIAKLKGDNIPKEDKKPRFKMTQKDFDYSDVNGYYGIENFSEINSYITESGLDVESACEQMGFTPEKTEIVKLIYAREFYMQGNYDKGDLFLKSVERSENKTKETKRIFEEIRKNKRFYQNRQGDNPTELVLSLVPKRKK